MKKGKGYRLSVLISSLIIIFVAVFSNYANITAFEIQPTIDAESSSGTDNESGETTVDDADGEDLDETNVDEVVEPEQEDEDSSENAQTTLEADSEEISLKYTTHISGSGWQPYVTTGENGKADTTLRLEALKVELSNTLKGNIKYQAHVQGIGWQSPVSNGMVSGTTGKSLRMEAVKISLDGELATTHDVYYRVYMQNKGWLDWTSNGLPTGSEGYGAVLQAIEMKVISKDDTSIINGENSFYKIGHTTYKGHVQGIGWQSNRVNGAAAGTVGQSKRLEGLLVDLPSDLKNSGGISYQSHVQGIGWQDWVSDNVLTGTTGKSLRMEGIQIKLTGEIASKYSVYYRVHIQGSGWLGWTNDGNLAGSVGCSKRIEAIEIKVLHKDMPAPKLSTAYITKPTNSFVQRVPNYYSQHSAPWGNYYYGRWTMSAAGCVPTSVAMALSGYVGRQVQPNEVANYLWHNTSEFNKTEAGASGLGVQYALRSFGVTPQGLSSKAQLDQALKDGKIVIALVGPGNWIGAGQTHAIVLHKYSNGTTYVYDPNTKQRNGWFNVNTVWSQQSKNAYDKRGGYVFYALNK